MQPIAAYVPYMVVGGVDHDHCHEHCYAHCHLAKFCDRIMGGNTAHRVAVKLAHLYEPSLETQVTGVIQPIVCPYFPLILQARNFAK